MLSLNFVPRSLCCCLLVVKFSDPGDCEVMNLVAAVALCNEHPRKGYEEIHHSAFRSELVIHSK